MHKHWRLIPVLAKIVDDILIVDVDEVVNQLIFDFNETFQFETVMPAPGTLRFYELNIIRDETF